MRPASAALTLLAALAAHAAGADVDAPRVSVDSTFPGYGTAVLTDGRWVPLDRQITQDYGSPDRLGNGGNSWVSAAQPGGEHWVQLEWPQAVEVNCVELWWALPEWYPQAFRVEVLAEGAWAPLGSSPWLVPTGQHALVGFPARELQALRVVQPGGAGGDRGLMAVQEIAALRVDAEPQLGGAREATDEELRRLFPRPLARNIARLHIDQPGADDPLAWTSGRTWVVTLLTDGDLLAPVELPTGSRAVGVRWPVRHVIDGAALHSRRPDASLIAEYHDGLRWRPVAVGLKSQAEAGRLTLSFEPVATRAFRLRGRGLEGATELEVCRYLPARPDVWPERLVEGNRFERELLASGREPSFEDLSSVALSMTPARALLGLKDARSEIGVTWDGRIISAAPIDLRFGEAAEGLAEYPDTVTRTLIDGWRPGTIVSGRIRDLAIRETAFVSFAAPGRERPCLYVRVELANLGSVCLNASVSARVQGPAGVPLTAQGRQVLANGALVLAALHPAALAEDGAVVTPLELRPGDRAILDFVQPYEGGDATDSARYLAARFALGLAEFRRYWDELLDPAARLELPEDRLNRMYRAVLTQLFINGDDDIMPYGSAPSCYEGSLYGVEEGFAMMALVYFGFAPDAQRYLDGTYLTPEFLRKVPVYREYADRHQQYRNGLQPYYAVSAFRFSRDEAWIRKHLELLRGCAEWTIRQRQTTMQLENGLRPLHWGLLPKWSYGGDISDLQCYPFYANYACWRGMLDTAWLMRDLGDSAAAQRYGREATAYRQTIDHAVEASYQPNHVPPFLPLQLYASEPVGDDYHQLFAGCLLDLQPFDPRGPQIGYVTDYLEQANLTFCCLPRFRRDVGPGGLDALYGLGYVLTKLAQGKVDEFLLGFYGYQALNLEHETFASRETNLIYASDLHVRSRYPVPDASDPIPCSSAVALHFLRHMLVTEPMDGSGEYTGDLVLLSGAPRAWFEHGERIRFAKLPTHFGPITCEVRSRCAEDMIEATVDAPPRSGWRSLNLRLPHPRRNPLRRVTVNGRPYLGFSGETAVIKLRPGAATYRVDASY